jgi:hypothetical protein
VSGNPLKPSPASARKGKNSYLLELKDGLVVQLRKMDAVQMVFEGYLTMPMMEAAGKYSDIQEHFASEDPEVRQKAVDEFMADPTKGEFIKVLREYACKHVITPVITMEEDGDPDHLCVKELEFSELFAIFNSAPGRDPEVREQVQEFRGTEPGNDGAILSPGKDVRSETELVAVPPERETQSY